MLTLPKGEGLTMANTKIKNKPENIALPEDGSEMENSWVLFELDQEQYGIRTENIREMVLFTEPSKIPDHPIHMRGVINLRGMVIPVIDLRKRLGKRGFLEETETLISILNAREKEHVDWLKELEVSVKEEREFTLTADPHQCEFGKWYDNYTTNNKMLQTQFRKFDQPHKDIHSIASDVSKLRAVAKKDDAQALVQYEALHKLSVLRGLFSETVRLIKDSVKEIVVIVESKNMRVGFVVDRVLEVTDIDPEEIQESPKIKNGVPSAFIQGLAKIGEGVKILLNVDELIFGEDVDFYKTSENSVVSGKHAHGHNGPKGEHKCCR